MSITEQEKNNILKSNPKKRRFSFLWLAVVIIGFTACIALVLNLYVAYMHHKQAAQYLAQRQHFSQSLELLKQSFDHLSQTMRTSVSQNKQQLVNMSEQLKQVQAPFHVTQAIYAIALANQQLKLAHHITIGISLLKAALHQLNQVNNPIYANLKIALQHDIATLTALMPMSTITAVKNINAIIEMIDQLNKQHNASKLHTSIAPDHHNQESLSPHSYWKKLKQYLSRFKTLFIIQHDEHSQLMLLQKSQYNLLRYNVKAKLYLAQWAAINGLQSMYQNSLQKAATWLNLYMRQQETIKPIIIHIREVENITIWPKTPPLESLRWMIRNTGNNRPETVSK